MNGLLARSGIYCLTDFSFHCGCLLESSHATPLSEITYLKSHDQLAMFNMGVYQIFKACKTTNSAKATIPK